MSCKDNLTCNKCGHCSCDCTCPDYDNDGCAFGEVQASCVIYDGEDIPCLPILKGETQKDINKKLANAVCNNSNGDDDKFVRISSTDSTSKYLLDALQAGNNVTLTRINPGLNERIRIELTVPAGNNPELDIDSSDNSILHTQLGDKGHVVDLRVNVSNNAGNGISKQPNGLFAPAPDWKVKVNANDTPDYLEDQILMLPSADGVIASWTQTITAGKVAFTPVIDFEALCERLTDLGCLNVAEPCDITITLIEAITDTNGNAAITIHFSGGIPDGFRYIVDGGSAVFTTASTFVLTSLSPGSHTITAQARCSSQTYGLSYQTGFEVPYAATPCPTSVVLTPGQTTIDVSWTLVPSATYSIELRTSSVGSPIQTKTETVGVNTTTFTALDPSTQYFVKVLATLNDLASAGCSNVATTTLSATCAATIDSITITDESADGSATATWTATGAASYEWRIDSGVWTATVLNSLNIAALSAGSHTFYVRAKCSNGVIGTTANAVVTIPATGTPSLTTSTVISITTTSAISGGLIIDAAGHTILERGLAYSTSANPTTADTKIVDVGVTTGLFASGLTALTPATTYHVRAYLVTTLGTYYGNDLAFTTLSELVEVNWGWFDTDPFTDLHTADTLTWQGSDLINSGDDIVASFASEPTTDKWEAFREPDTEPVKITWFNTSFNNGTIVPEDSVMRAPFTANGYRYYVTRTAEVGFTTTDTVVLST